jgi:hypothetical protein
VLPSDGVGQVTHDGKVAPRFQPHHFECIGDNNTHLLVVRGRDTFERRKTLQRRLTTSGLLVNHAADGPPNHHRGALIVERSSARVGGHGLSAELSILDTVTNHYIG